MNFFEVQSGAFFHVFRSSNIIFKPSWKDIFGAHFKIFFAFFIEAKVMSGSPGRLGIYFILFGFNILTKLFIDMGLPHPIFIISVFSIFFREDKINASTTSLTKVKSLLCLPSPTIVIGKLFAN